MEKLAGSLKVIEQLEARVSSLESDVRTLKASIEYVTDATE